MMRRLAQVHASGRGAKRPTSGFRHPKSDETDHDACAIHWRDPPREAFLPTPNVAVFRVVGPARVRQRQHLHEMAVSPSYARGKVSSA